MTDSRDCEQCGATFVPRREHARFCSARCRVAWNRENASDRAADATALDWSVVAMRDATARQLRVRPWDSTRACAVISEAVWWVTIVDATLVRHHPDTYDEVLAGQPPAQRRQIRDTLRGLRFVRNRMGYYLDPADFACPAPAGSGGHEGRVAGWIWKPLPEPVLSSLPARGQAWELERYRAYQAQLAGHPVRETFSLAEAFLGQAAAETTPDEPDPDSRLARATARQP